MSEEERSVGVLKDSPIPDDAHKNLVLLKAQRFGDHVQGELHRQIGELVGERRHNDMVHIMNTTSVLMTYKRESRLWNLAYFCAGTAVGLLIIKFVIGFA